LELLIVILLIGILASLLLFAVNHARSSARSVQCANNLRQLALGVRMYADANHGRLPDGKEKPWFQQIAPILESQPAIFRCPDDPQGVELSYGWRDEAVCIPAASLAGKKLERIAKSDLAMIFDASPGWHAPNMVNVALVNASSTSMTEDEFEDNLLLDAETGKLFFLEMP
jgi:type II secretory pathway pseudopilin PulG